MRLMSPWVWVYQCQSILRELRRQKFDGNISIEYANATGKTPSRDIAQCVGYVGGFCGREGKP